jgi:hypothetical protein
MPHFLPPDIPLYEYFQPFEPLVPQSSTFCLLTSPVVQPTGTQLHDEFSFHTQPFAVSQVVSICVQSQH